MAVADLHNLSVIESSFLRESQPSSSRQSSDEGRASARASSLLQMWRELEDEHLVSHAQDRERLQRQRTDAFNADLLILNLPESQGSEQRGSSEAATESENECETWSQGQTDSRNYHEDRNSSIWEQSHDFGEVERERVRQIFREWMTSGAGEHTSGVPQRNSNSRAQWLGENERERVRVVREWIQMTSEHRANYGSSSDEQADEICAQIERVRDGLVVNHFEGQTEHARRDIRRLCGRQALLDMLLRSQRERQGELQGLLEHRAVSNFAYRNRIQSLLRGRFLRNGRLVKEERPTSVAASELGLLRQRHTVSGLRGGFFSRLDSIGHGHVSTDNSDISSNNEINGFGSEGQADSSQEVLGEVTEQSVHDVEESDIHGLSGNTQHLGGNTVNDVNYDESAAAGGVWQEQVSENEERDWQQTAAIEFSDGRESSGEDMDGNLHGSASNEWFQETSENERGEHSYLQEPIGIFHEQSEPSNEEHGTHGLSDRSSDIDGGMVDDINGQESAAIIEDWQEQGTESEERDWQSFTSVEFNNLRENGGRDMDRNWQEISVHGWLQETSRNETGEHNRPQETHSELHDDGSQEAVDNWLEGPSAREPVDTFFLQDDDNVYNMELRELLSRRRVSNLLHSGFRESLDQLIQSYVERQGRAPVEWEEHETLPSPGDEQDPEQQTEDQNNGLSVVVETPAPHSLPGLPSQSLWDQELHHANWPQYNTHQRLGIEWDIINDLKVDMARLQQRLNNMQRMLEACMDMQLELQRSVRQEVSAALNRSMGLAEASENSSPKDLSKWDHVRKGICCRCCDCSIDSLLYRCGHMCTCSKCANELVEGKGKCPMCRAPVIEVIRAYSIQ
ncbi:uncharacterized protein LOC131149431 isoform X2 [Malania oleifera]|uniref:uncharacterized protein LOC131149431 isoform X2 n=1 Tax=Malania oleifera TaxID=397392 RepID=UPI0025ADE13E|nr:uncharacterized protein LOC131149431 isoform X2 [Malania oleifera]